MTNTRINPIIVARWNRLDALKATKKFFPDGDIVSCSSHGIDMMGIDKSTFVHCGNELHTMIICLRYKRDSQQYQESHNQRPFSYFITIHFYYNLQMPLIHSSQNVEQVRFLQHRTTISAFSKFLDSLTELICSEMTKFIVLIQDEPDFGTSQ